MKKYTFLLIAAICIMQSAVAQTGNIVIPDGHGTTIENMLISADGKYLYTANNQKIIMWDIKKHIQLYSFSLAVDKSVTDALGSFMLSNDGNYVAATGGFGIKCFSTVTGKSVFNTDGLHYSATFSADSKKLFYEGRMDDPATHRLTTGILSTDLATLKDESIFICTTGVPCNYTEFTALKNGQVMFKHPTGWQIADLDSKKIIFTSDVDTKTDVFGKTEQKKFFTIPNSNLIAAKENKKGDYRTMLIFYNALSGEKMFTKEISGDWKVFPSVDGTSFILKAGSYEEYIELFDAKTGNLIKKINNSSLSLSEDVKLSAGIVDFKNKNIFYGSMGDINQIAVQSLIVSTNFKSQIAAFGGINEHNEQKQQFRLITNSSNYVEIDLNRMVVEKSVKIQRQGGKHFSASSDTILVDDDDGKAYFYSLKTGKKTTINPALFGGMTFNSDERPNTFFGREGKFAYVIKNVYSDANRSDQQSVYQINLATNTNKKIADFQHNLEIDVKQDLIAGYDKTNSSFVVKCWQLSTGKQIFTKVLPRNTDEKDLLAAKFFDGISKIAILNHNNLLVFNIADGKLLSTGKSAMFGKYSIYYIDSKITIGHNASLIAEIYDKGVLGLVDTSLNQGFTIQAHDGSINDAYFSADDDLIYTAGDDNTIKIFKTATGKLVGTMYIFKDSKDFVFVDSTGRFDGTHEGIKKLYYLKDRKVITLDKVYEKFYTPSLYQRLLNEEVFAPINVEIKGIPKVKITYAEAKRNLEVEEDIPNYKNNTGFADIVVNATTEDDAIDEIRLFHNGKIVTLTTRNLIVADNEGGSQTKKYQLALLPGTNNIRAIALNSQRTESDADEIVVSYNATNDNQPTPKPAPTNSTIVTISPVDKNATMYLMVVGINAYTNKINPLSYALPDATAFKDEIEKDAKSVLANVKTYFITDAKADKAGIINAFNQIKKDAKPQDVFVFYYAGHGYISPTNKEFYLVTADVADGGESLLKNGIPAKDLQQYAVDIQAQKQLFILDACQSAGAFDAMLKHDGEQQKSLAVVARSTGTHWMAASGSTETAKEFGQLGHGAFTYVLLQALKGQAATNKMITVNGMKNFLQIQVPELVKKYGSNNQYPASYGFGNDFPVELIK